MERTETGDVPALEVRNLEKHFGTLHVLKGVSLAVRRGEVAAIIGPSGGGKSTLLRCINFLEEPDGGEVLVKGEHFGRIPMPDGRWVRQAAGPFHRGRSRMPMVFQRFNLFQHLTALGNVMEGPMRVLGLSRRAAHDRGVETLTKVGLQDKLEAFPVQLSGGQQQRVGIARALAMEPEAILFDEPTSSLDPELVGEVLESIRRLAAEGLTMLVVTHEMRFARDTADRVYFLDNGLVLEEGPPAQIFENPENPRLRSFMSALSH